MILTTLLLPKGSLTTLLGFIAGLVGPRACLEPNSYPKKPKSTKRGQTTIWPILAQLQSGQKNAKKAKFIAIFGPLMQKKTALSF